MTDGLLENIIELEKQIQADVAAEQARASEWQERELAELQNLSVTARRSESARRNQVLAEQKDASNRESEALEAAAAEWSQRLINLDEGLLRAVLNNDLAAILPRGDHDHPHGQS